MISLGAIALDLIVNNGRFLSGFSEAGLASKKFRAEFESAFRGLGDVALTALGPLGEFGTFIGETLQRVGQFGAQTAGILGQMGAGLGGVAAAGGIAASAMGAVSLGAIGLAIHTAESAAQMYELSQSTGIGVAALSGLSYAAKQTGVPTEALTKGLEFLSKAAVQAAIAPEGTKTAFSRLGISVKDDLGHIKDAQTLFIEVAEKISNLPVPEQGYFARLIFGRGGQALLPLIDEGAFGIDLLIKKAESLGIVLDEETGKSAEAFKRSLNDIAATGTSLALRLTKDLLPALQYIADRLSVAFQTGDLQRFVDKLADVTKQVIVLAYEIGHISDLTIVRSLLGNLSSEKIAKFGPGIDVEQYKKDVAEVKKGVMATEPLAPPFPGFPGYIPPPPPPGSRGGGADLGRDKERRDIIAETIGKLQAQTTEEAALANAIRGTTANTILATAAAEAEKTIFETNVRAKQEHRALTEDQKKQIRELTLLLGAEKEAYKDNKELQDFITKTDLQTASLRVLSDAYRTNDPLVIQHAEEIAKLAPFEARIKIQRELIDSLHAMGRSWIELSPLILSLNDDLDKLDKARPLVHAEAIEQQTVNVRKATDEIKFQTDALEKQIPAILGGAAALRQYAIDQAVIAEQKKNPLADLTAFRQEQIRKSEVPLIESAAKKVETSQPFLATLEDIKGLELLRDAETTTAEQRIAINLVLAQTKLKYIEEIRAATFNAQNAELIGESGRR